MELPPAYPLGRSLSRLILYFLEFRKLLATLAQQWSIVSSAPISGVGTRFHNHIHDASQFLTNKINQTELSGSLTLRFGWIRRRVLRRSLELSSLQSSRF
jgi:hypothetical protein